MMVRKPVPQQSVPYPITPSSPSGSRSVPALAEDVQAEGPDIGKAQIDESIGPEGDANVWQSANDSAFTQNGLSSQLLGGRGRMEVSHRRNEDIPAALRIGSTETTPRSSWEGSRPVTPDMDAVHLPRQPDMQSAPEMVTANRERSASNNPYRQMHNNNGKAAERADIGVESSADVWGEDASVDQNSKEVKPIRYAFAEPWMKFETCPVSPIEPLRHQGPQIVDHGTAHDITENLMTDYGEQRAAQAPILDVLSPLSQGNQSTQVEFLPKAPMESPRAFAQIPTYSNEQFSAVPLHDDGGNYPHSSIVGTGKEPIRPHDDGSPERWRASSSVGKPPIYDPYSNDTAPPLPPRRSQEEQLPPPQPPRPPKMSEVEYGVTGAAPSIVSKQEESGTKKRAGETYQIRLVNWYDASSPTNPRRSPIMVQNANGPCPLLALVNALVLSTPSEIETALVETLRVREQVSLGLLLDAVIDELMSGRRGSNLPDVSDLYAFLVNLHTGMNVNPRFVPFEAQALNLIDAPIDGSLPNNQQNYRTAGGFEDTREMKLYSTFTIPLIHGWLPPRNHPAYASLKRSAKTYEDAQNFMFREEELEEKLQRQGLSPGEQVILEDIANVKHFLSSTATQLTGYGLDTMTETLTPGSVAILFRNDHFSTLYRHPRSGQLLTLVTDMGYAGHDEVVWESLVDVSGEGCEFFSGDFRPVGNVAVNTQPPQQDDSGWTTVGSKAKRPQRNGSAARPDLPPLSTLNINDSSSPLSPNTEQEDHDLALAMQLQEEEEERERQEAAKRRRDDELSQAYLNNSDSSGRRTFPGFGRGATGAHNGPSPPPRGGGSSRQIPERNRPPPPRKSSISEDAPPPTYEQAAKGPAYIPPTTHPAHPNSSPNPGFSTPAQRPLNTRPRGASAYSEHAASYNASPSYGAGGSGRRGQMPRSANGRGGGSGVDPGMVRRRSAGPSSAVSPEDDKKDKDCIVM
ncbi:ubiquitin carboxyl-terminal hydrolase MINDY-1/2, partial [Lecanoromycetidae sp. Uapishka_2]